LLTKCSTRNDWDKSIEVFQKFQARVIEVTSETGTLLIKAACRANVPEEALQLLQNLRDVRLWPTIAGIHYLMINFSLKKNTKGVLDSFEVSKLRKLEPNTRTFHILIRECVDNSLIKEAIDFANQAKQKNIPLNRVTYNILMNGYRKTDNPEGILKLRSEMNSNKIDINDTTVKFTTLAYMMLNQQENAIEEFLKFPDLNKQGEIVNKFKEVIEENPAQKELIENFFQSLKEKNIIKKE